MNVRCQIAVVVLDEDGNEVATMWPVNKDASEWVTASRLELTQGERDSLADQGVQVLESLRKHWVKKSMEEP